MRFCWDILHGVYDTSCVTWSVILVSKRVLQTICFKEIKKKHLKEQIIGETTSAAFIFKSWYLKVQPIRRIRRRLEIVVGYRGRLVFGCHAAAGSCFDFGCCLPWRSNRRCRAFVRFFRGVLQRSNTIHR